jgi:NTE family protein
MNVKRDSLADRRATPNASPEAPKSFTTAFQSIALLLQGGGALGAYQAGVFEALQESGITPSLIAGISIGAINSAIIAGNAPEERVAKLRSFWELVSDDGDGELSASLSGLSAGGDQRSLFNQAAAARESRSNQRPYRGYPRATGSPQAKRSKSRTFVGKRSKNP